MAALLLLTLSVSASPARADQPDRGDVPRISIIIDDVGYRRNEDLEAIELPGPLAYAILPHSPHATSISELANRNGKEVLLHLPMEAQEQDKNRFLGPGALTLNMSRQKFLATVRDDLHSFPNIIGVNNHMGSLLTRIPGYMEWLMHYLRHSGKFYIDSMTSGGSVANGIARENHVPSMRRDVFLDNIRSMSYINGQFDELIEIARHKGYAIAIGHPHPETLAVLANRLRTLDAYGVRLVSLSQMLKDTGNQGQLLKASLDR
jgi:hypothetical protein